MAATDLLTNPPIAHSRREGRVLWTAQIVLALFIGIASGLPKLFGEANAVEIFDDIDAGDWLRYLVGVLEVAGAIGLVTRRYSAAAAAGLVGVMIGAAFTQLFVLDDPLLALTPVALGMAFGAIALRRGFARSTMRATARG
ncbi:MAG: DoxX family protein [Actinomycetota bacterium]|nr:DoxX family protein [Actinomycetota bacterium]